MLSDCCIHLISLLSTTSLYIATEYAGLGAFDSECKLQRIRIQPGLCQALIWLVCELQMKQYVYKCSANRLE